MTTRHRSRWTLLPLLLLIAATPPPVAADHGLLWHIPAVVTLYPTAANCAGIFVPDGTYGEGGQAELTVGTIDESGLRYTGVLVWHDRVIVPGASAYYAEVATDVERAFDHSRTGVRPCGAAALTTLLP